MTRDILLGVDVGTSDSKVLVTTRDGQEVTSVATPTRWRTHAGALTDTEPQTLVDDVVALLRRAVEAGADALGPVRVAGIAVTGMAEAGVLLDGPTRGARPLHPVIAWFDPRGEDEVRRLPEELVTRFQGTTGLPLSPLATIAKLAWMRVQGTDLAGCRWLNVPEYLVHRLGGQMATEMSLLARTGLLDQDTERLWPVALDALGATADLLPPAARAGVCWGVAGGDDVPAELHGAALTVAGHDHPVAAVGCGVVGPEEVFDSFGTAEALVRTVSTPLARDARERLAQANINSVHHVLEGRRLLLAGTKAGLLMRRTLQLLGAAEPAARARLDEAAVAADSIPRPDGVRVTGADNSDGALRVVVDADGVDPTALWLATLAHGVDEAGLALARMESEVGPASGATVAGGWTRMQSVRRAKERSLPDVRFSDRTQAGAFGAAMFAAFAAEQSERGVRVPDDATAGRGGVPLDLPGPSQQYAAVFTRGAHRTAAPLEEIPV
ncbi:FGGY-family carbohydrate kinase [Nakamurella endophytica]|uniref:Xylulose kinase n=1 Tax=Nakamurella endophytica TaxID=1748367 RepID=A0A917WJL4_9ACTN|nr:FGGY family carbohydrate kinase [Nakamurella endophytica]GGM10852.1 xylulose kinase [Nakamurella endophytica]